MNGTLAIATKMRRKSLSPRNHPRLSIAPSLLAACFLLGCLLGHFHTRQFVWSNENNQALLLGSLRTSTSLPTDGWHSIDVFYGKTVPLEMSLNNATWFSQAKQDQAVHKLLRAKQHGYFIDLAANDAVKWSNTYALERFHHWDGICIEPNPIYWKNLSYRHCHVVGAVVGAQRDERVYFRHEAGDHGGIAGDGFDNGPRWVAHSRIEYTVTLLEILERLRAPREIDYLSLDVEGSESFIMTNFPLDRYRIKFITAERLRGPVRQYLNQHGYRFVKKLTRWGESLWAHQSVQFDTTDLDEFGFPLF